MAEICDRHGLTLPDGALQFPLLEPAVASVVCGMRTAAQVDSTVQRASVPISAQVWAELAREALPG
jgi:D-threo-aldose 1-dehydrogenase